MKNKKQFGEQDAPSEPATGGASTSTTSKWESGATRGRANPIDSKAKWESGATRGKANPIDSKAKWESGATRGKANPLN